MLIEKQSQISLNNTERQDCTKRYNRLKSYLKTVQSRTMARPVKNYCDYFPHDRDMRNHRKIKAIRTKYKAVGYAIWCMTLEYLTGIDGNVFEYSDVEIELMAGDFGVSATEIRGVLDYCIKLELLFIKDGFVQSESLDERLKPVYDKRGVSKEKSKKQSRTNGKFISNNPEPTVVSVTEKPQSKVNRIKVDESKINTAVGPVAPVPKKRKAAKKNKDSEPYWTDLVKVYFSFCFEKFNEKPSFSGSDPSEMHRIIESLKKRASEQGIEWTQEVATLRWRGFLGTAHQDDWLSKNWLLSHLNRQKDKVFLNLVNKKNGTYQQQASKVGETIEFDKL